MTTLFDYGWIDPTTKQLLWRGRGVAAVSDDEKKYEWDLKQTVTAVLDRFPHAHAELSVLARR